MVKCNVPVRGWVNGIGGCPNVGGICMACTMPGFPDKYMPFMEEDAEGRGRPTIPARFTYGPDLQLLRGWEIRHNVRQGARRGGTTGAELDDRLQAQELRSEEET